MYQPKPLDTGAIQLPERLEDLLAQLAQNTHEVWAAQRLKDGWNYGSERDDSERRHPCLVPYDELPEEEKEYDRNTAREVLKAIIAAGFTIERH